MTLEQPAPKGVWDLQERRDRHLLERIAAGDQPALAELLRRYGGAALGLARRVVADQALAEDVVQDVFVSVWQNAGTFDPMRGTVRSWLMSRIHHRAVDIVRREESHRRRTTTTFVPTADAPTPDDVVEQDWITSRRVKVRSALAELSDEQRSVIDLTFFDGCSQSEAATKLGIPLGTIKSRTTAAMRRLRAALGAGGDDA